MKRLLLLTILLPLAGCGDSSAGASSYVQVRDWIMGPTTEQRLKQTFLSEDADRRREGIVYFSGRKSGLEEPYLKMYAQMTKDAEQSVRSAAVIALGRAGDEAYIPTILDLLARDRSLAVRINAADALDNMKHETIVQPLRDHGSDDPEIQVRIRCLRALRHYQRKDVLQTLMTCVGDDDFGVRHVARQTLVKLTNCDGGYEMDNWTRLLAGKEDPFTPSQADKP